jgi:parallel beta-helix repeat protein
VAFPPLRPAAFFWAVVPPWDELLPEPDFLPPRDEEPGALAILAARSLDMPLSFRASYCFSFFTLGLLFGIGSPFLTLSFPRIRRRSHSSVCLRAHAGARGTRIEKNRIRGNEDDGIRLASDGSSAVIDGNELTANGGAGVFVDAGSVRIGPGNRITTNGSGILVDDEDPDARIAGNMVTRNYGDGFHLRSEVGLRIQDNIVRDNGKAAFSFVRRPGAERPFPDNEVGSHPMGRARVRGLLAGP